MIILTKQLREGQEVEEAEAFANRDLRSDHLEFIRVNESVVRPSYKILSVVQLIQEKEQQEPVETPVALVASTPITVVPTTQKPEDGDFPLFCIFHFNNVFKLKLIIVAATFRFV